MKILDLVIGRKILIMTDAKVEVELEIESAEELNHSIDLEPSTHENDWYPKTQNWNTIEIKFTNGFNKSYRNLNEINIL